MIGVILYWLLYFVVIGYWVLVFLVFSLDFTLHLVRNYFPEPREPIEHVYSWEKEQVRRGVQEKVKWRRALDYAQVLNWRRRPRRHE